MKHFISNEKKILDYQYVFFDSKIIKKYPINLIVQIFKNIKNLSAFICYDNPVAMAKIINLYNDCLSIKNFFNTNHLVNYQGLNISIEIINKIRITYYGLGDLNVKYNFKQKNFEYNGVNLNERGYDLFYLGSASENRRGRKQIVKEINKLAINNSFVKLMINNEDKLSPSLYLENIVNSKVNLSLSGNYENISMTFYEFCFLKKFFLIDAHILNFLVSKKINNINDIVFYNIKDFAKLYYFYQNEETGDKLINSISDDFRKFYNPETHGKYIFKLLQN